MASPSPDPYPNPNPTPNPDQADWLRAADEQAAVAAGLAVGGGGEEGAGAGQGAGRGAGEAEAEGEAEGEAEDVPSTAVEPEEAAAAAADDDDKAAAADADDDGRWAGAVIAAKKAGTTSRQKCMCELCSVPTTPADDCEMAAKSGPGLRGSKTFGKVCLRKKRSRNSQTVRPGSATPRRASPLKAWLHSSSSMWTQSGCFCLLLPFEEEAPPERVSTWPRSPMKRSLTKKSRSRTCEHVVAQV